MQATILAKLREWSILITALCIALGGILYAASFSSTPPESLAVAPTAASSQPQASVASRNSAAPPQSSAAVPAPADPATPSRPPASSGPTAHQMHGHAPTQPSSAPALRAAATNAPPTQPVTPAPPPILAGGTAVDGDAATGRQVYRKCQACHSLEVGKNALGPSLAGIIGKKSGEVPNYNYSPAMKAANLTWDAATLDAYLLDPSKLVPQNKMPFAGLKTVNERKDVIAYLVAAASPAGAPAVAQRSPSPAAAPVQPPAPGEQRASVYLPEARYTLRTGIAEGRMVYLGVGGTIDGQVNPLLSAAEGQTVQIILINGEGAEHDIVFPEQNARSSRIFSPGASTAFAFRATRAGDFTYLCSVPGHELAGMRGQLVVTPRLPDQVLVEADISRKSTEVPPPVGQRPPQTVQVELNAVELEGRLAEGTTFGYWTFNGRVPGPMLRVRVGDTVDVRVKNSADSTMVHSVDFHATTGPGGGAASTQVDPGAEKSFKFKALIPGLYVYHCATPMVAHHIANGMYGLMLVEPEGGLPAVDREFYVMQGEIYTEAPFGHRGSQEFSVEKLLNERPEYFVFNGSVGALSKLHPLEAKVGETVRIYFGVGGPNYTSSFHVIGEIFDRVYNLGGLLSEPLRGVQTVTVPAGGAVITEFKVEVPGNYMLVDHALSRAERGLVGMLHVEGPPNPEIFDGKIEPGTGH
ncbi:nitrite reductase, copper-containing [Bradyrhizobium sp. AUGA SZCCT0222]|uniref:copper-containing nitrite reductase n=1 Tax=Bradyrhizobium sp. AUGA SZCCT0222 TaxID=2807668 RepID=UPI001BA51C7D|nr:nitrite reductase, copper-containing [Bradyrhizobium sp. AUGA SZCCT0222]